jgi:hypothetical protein
MIARAAGSNGVGGQALIVQRIADVLADQAYGFHLAPAGVMLGDDETGEEYSPALVLLTAESAVAVVVETTDGFAVNDVYSGRARCYRSIPSVRHYVIASLDRPQIASFSRLDERQWLYGVAENLQDEVHLQSLGVSLKLAEIYDGVFTADEQSA